MKYWNEPFVLEIYIRVTKNCIYTIKIGYALTLIQKSYVKSPLGFLSFQTSANDTDDGNAGVSIPFGVSALLNKNNEIICSNRCKFQSPLGFLLFQTNLAKLTLNPSYLVSIPFGVSALLNLDSLQWGATISSFNPLWGFCSSKLMLMVINNDRTTLFQSPLGFLHFQTASLQSQYLCELN